MLERVAAREHREVLHHDGVAERAKPSPVEFNRGDYWKGFLRRVGQDRQGGGRIAPLPRPNATEVIVWDGSSDGPRVTPESQDEMLRLLAPYAGHRQRVVRLIEVSGARKPRFGPRYSPLDFRAM